MGDCPRLSPSLLPEWRHSSRIPMFQGAERPARNSGGQCFIPDEGSPLHRMGLSSFGGTAEEMRRAGLEFAQSMFGPLDGGAEAQLAMEVARQAGFTRGSAVSNLSDSGGVGFRVQEPGTHKPSWTKLSMCPFDYRGRSGGKWHRQPGVVLVWVEGTAAMTAAVHRILWETPHGRALWGLGTGGPDRSVLERRHMRLDLFRATAWVTYGLLVGPGWEVERFPTPDDRSGAMVGSPASVAPSEDVPSVRRQSGWPPLGSGVAGRAVERAGPAPPVVQPRASPPREGRSGLLRTLRPAALAEWLPRPPSLTLPEDQAVAYSDFLQELRTALIHQLSSWQVTVPGAPLPGGKRSSAGRERLPSEPRRKAVKGRTAASEGSRTPSEP